jgi:hypothetical protein
MGRHFGDKVDITDTEIKQLIKNCESDICPHCKQSLIPKTVKFLWFTYEKYTYKPLSDYSEGGWPIRHCCIERFSDWSTLISCVNSKQINMEQLSRCH